MPIYSPLRYPGGKRKLIPYIEKVLQQNPIDITHYAEPYAGGAGVALHFLFTGKSKYIHINDFNKSIYAFWYSILNNTDEFCDAILNVDVTVDEWYKQKTLQHSESMFELGFSTFFLNRTNRSGIINGGIIGGFEQKGHYKIDARFSKKRLINRIRKIASLRERIFLTRKDAIVFLKEDVLSLPKEATLIYLDPPYYVKGQKLYDNFYQHQDHVDIANLLRNTDFYWLLSYDNCPEIIELYNGSQLENISLSYTAQDKTKGKEVMIFSQKLTPTSQTLSARN